MRLVYCFLCTSLALTALSGCQSRPEPMSVKAPMVQLKPAEGVEITPYEHPEIKRQSIATK